MKICFMCDLHLTNFKTSVQYDAFDWALDNVRRMKPDAVVIAGDLTSDGNIFAAKRFTKRIQGLEVANIPAFYIPGSSDYLSPKNIPYFKQISSACHNVVCGTSLILLNDADRQISEEDFIELENAPDDAVIVLHHPVEELYEPSRKRLAIWRANHPNNDIFYGHLHRASNQGSSHCLQALDPDKASGENPAITYFDTETKELSKEYYFCPAPADLAQSIGISCYNPLQDLEYAAAQGVWCVELHENAADVDRTTLMQSIVNWRKSGGKVLSLHAPEITITDSEILGEEGWDAFISLAMYLGVNRVTMHVPNMSLEAVNKDRKILDIVADFLAKRLAMLPNHCIVGVENLHITPNDRSETKRRFGYLPSECAEFMKHLQSKSPRKVGICLNIGHAANNGSFSDTSPLGTWYGEIGRYVVMYHIHQLRETAGRVFNYAPLTELYGGAVSLASFFRCLNLGILNKAPVILEIHGDGEYKESLEIFRKESKRLVQDLHTHTLYSACGSDRPEKMIAAAIKNGVHLLGISDHNYGIGERKTAYVRKIRDFAAKYADHIRVLCGIEIATIPRHYDIVNTNVLSEYDYCLIEHILDDSSIVGGDLIGFCKKLPLVCGIAHTDLFAYFEKYGHDPKTYLKKMAENHIFWEMNVCYDSVHFYREHDYVKNFMSDEAKQNLVREAGLAVSIGSDCHRAEEYVGKRVHDMYDFLISRNIRTADTLFSTNH